MSTSYPNQGLSDKTHASLLPTVHFTADKFVRGARELDDCVKLLESAPFGDAFRRHYPADAHFVTYVLSNGDPLPRLTKSVLPRIRAKGGDVLATMLVLDYDNPGHASWKSGGWNALLERLRAATVTFPLAMSWTGAYITRHGARLVYVLDYPIPVDLAERKHAGLCQLFHKNGFPEIDLSCSDWTRLFRFPFVTRDGKPTWEDAHVG